ncbi:MAG: MBL fold metallo-hydrolase [Oscillospiraceae bacterium]|nr:MBL fold metallo-hydrolase [Oscillospiraceae bacterium]
MKRKQKKRIPLWLGILILVVVIGNLFFSKSPSPVTPASTGELQVHFIDVGQADCILLMNENESMLIDAGNNNDGDLVCTYLQSMGITKLDYLIGTHPHEDHIGGLDVVIQNFDIQNFMMPKFQANTATFEEVLDAALDKNLKITAPKQGDTFTLGTALVTAVQCYETTKETNNASIILRVDFGETSFLFTGDAEMEAENAVLLSGVNIDCDVLKAGHHGSHTSSSRAFLDAVSPEYAVISCGTGNSYGHPHKETLQAYENRNITVYRTDLQGTVRAFTDGKNLRWETAKGG